MTRCESWGLFSTTIQLVSIIIVWPLRGEGHCVLRRLVEKPHFHNHRSPVRGVTTILHNLRVPIYALSSLEYR